MYHAPQLVKYVNKCHPGVASGHTWSGVSHHLAYPFALLLFVAMDGALGAGWLVLAVGAFSQTPFRVAHQGGAGITQIAALLAMVVLTINGGHAHQGLVLPL